jgi:hypothetical protein
MEFTQPQVDDITTQTKVDEPASQNVETTAEQQADQGAETSANQYKLKITYNDAEEELDEETARTLAQKGKNYDKKVSQLDEATTKLRDYDSNELIQYLKKQAEKSNVSFSDFSKRYFERLNEQSDAEIARQKKIPIDEVRAQRIANERAERAEAELATVKNKAAEQERAESELEELKKAYPDALTKPLPKEVVDAYKAGANLVREYKHYIELNGLRSEIEKMTSQQQIEHVNNENAGASTGKLGGAATTETPLTDEMIAKMSPEELDKNHERIAKHLGLR